MFSTAFSIITCSFSYFISSFCYFFTFTHTVLPLGLDVGILGVVAYYLTKLKAPKPENVVNIFGPLPGSQESESNPENVVRCIAHRGAGLDAPENTLEAFKYCVEHDCSFVELDVRCSRDNELVLLHDPGLERLAGSEITDIKLADWDNIKNIDIGSSHPNRNQFQDVRLCLLKDALDYLLPNNVKIIIDVKGTDSEVIEGVVRTFQERPALYETACVTCFNPFVLYQIRSKDPNIVGAISYRPHCFSTFDYDAATGPTNKRYPDSLPMQLCSTVCDYLHALAWRRLSRWCSASAVLLHKDIVSRSEVAYWHDLNVRCIGWCVNRPLEKLYWRGVLNAPYLANTLVAEPDRVDEKHTAEKTKIKEYN